MSFCLINIFKFFWFDRKNVNKSWFIKEIHNKIKINKNIEKVHNKQQETILNENLFNDEL